MHLMQRGEMNCGTFQTLPTAKKKDVIRNWGEILFVRHQDQGDLVLYQLEGFYVEVAFSGDASEDIRFNAFEDTELLNPYLELIDITGVFPESQA